MSAKPIQLNLVSKGEIAMFTRDQFLELFSLTNYRNAILYDCPQFVITKSSWPKFRGILFDHTGLEFPLDLTEVYGDGLWDKLDARTSLVVSRNRFPPPSICYKTCSAMAQLAGIRSLRDWFDKIPNGFRKLNLAVPGDPPKAYADVWQGWGEFLQTKRLSTQEVRKHKWGYADAKRFVQKYEIKKVDEFREFMKTPLADSRLPKRPDHFYAGKGWKGWSDFLCPRFLTYKQAKKVMKPFGLRTESDFRKLGKAGKRPDGIPSLPYVTYGDEFESWADFLGYEGSITYPKRRQSLKSKDHSGDKSELKLVNGGGK